MRKSIVENPYNSFISIQSEFFDTSTRVCSLQAPLVEESDPKMSSEQLEALNEHVQRQQVQLESRNDLLLQRDAEIDRLKDKINNQAMDMYFKVSDEMNKQFKDYYASPDTNQQMDELLDDLKKQSEQDSAENKSLFASIATIEAEMEKYNKWIEETKVKMD